MVPFAPVGEGYTATAKLVAKPDDPAPGSGKAPSFRNFAAPRTLADANNAWWSVTSWQERRLMQSYVRTDPHRTI